MEINNDKINLLYLPNSLIRNIFNYLNYIEKFKFRTVSKIILQVDEKEIYQILQLIKFYKQMDNFEKFLNNLNYIIKLNKIILYDYKKINIKNYVFKFIKSYQNNFINKFIFTIENKIINNIAILRGLNKELINNFGIKYLIKTIKNKFNSKKMKVKTTVKIAGCCKQCCHRSKKIEHNIIVITFLIFKKFNYKKFNFF